MICRGRLMQALRRIAARVKARGDNLGGRHEFGQKESLRRGAARFKCPRSDIRIQYINVRFWTLTRNAPDAIDGLFQPRSYAPQAKRIAALPSGPCGA